MNYRNLNYSDSEDIRKAILKLSCCSGGGLELGAELTGGDPNAVLFLDGSSLLDTNPSLTFSSSKLNIGSVSGGGGVSLSFRRPSGGSEILRYDLGNSGVNIYSLQTTTWNSGSTTVVPLNINGTTGQTANLQNWQVNGSALSYIDSDGQGVFNPTGTIVSGFSKGILIKNANPTFRVTETSSNRGFGILQAGVNTYFTTTNSDWTGLNHLANFGYDGYLHWGSATSQAHSRMMLSTVSTSIKGLTINGVTGQTADLQQWQVNGVNLLNVLADGGLAGGTSIGRLYMNSSKGSELSWGARVLKLLAGSSVLEAGSARFTLTESSISATLQAKLNITNSSISDVSLTINAPTGQTANLQEWQVNGTTLSYINSAGNFNGNRVIVDITQGSYWNSKNNGYSIAYGSGTNGHMNVFQKMTVGVAAVTTAVSTLDNYGSEGQSYTEVTTTSYTADDGDRIIYVDDDTAAGVVTITLPAVASSERRIYTILKKGTTANVVIDGNSSETINGAATQTLTSQYESISIHCDGSEWFIIEA